MNSPSTFNRQIAEEAAAWSILIDDGPLSWEQKSDLLSWLKKSPQHLEEFLLALSMLEGVGFSQHSLSADVKALLDQATADVVHLKGVESADEKKGRSTFSVRENRSLTVPIAACLIAFFGALLLVQPILKSSPADNPSVMTTQLGEQRSITLEDGSIVYINTQSHLSIDYSQDARLVEIVFGEALFDVKRDENRPFRVIAGRTTAEALGTQFNVRHFENATEVSVVEGQVAFERHGHGFGNIISSNANDEPTGRLENGKVILNAGAHIVLDANAVVPKIRRTNVEDIYAWTARKLVFNRTQLSKIVEEFNRYNPNKLIVESQDLASMSLSGVFAADDPESLLDFLRVTNDIEVISDGSQTRIRKRVE